MSVITLQEQYPDFDTRIIESSDTKKKDGYTIQLTPNNIKFKNYRLKHLVIVSKNNYIHYAEIEFYGINGVKIDKSNLYAVQSTSYNEQLYPAKNVIDGNINSFSSTQQATVYPDKKEFLRIYLRSPKEIKRIILVKRKDCCIDRYDDHTFSCKFINYDPLRYHEQSALDTIVTVPMSISYKSQFDIYDLDDYVNITLKPEHRCYSIVDFTISSKNNSISYAEVKFHDENNRYIDPQNANISASQTSTYNNDNRYYPSKAIDNNLDTYSLTKQKSLGDNSEYLNFYFGPKSVKRVIRIELYKQKGAVPNIYHDHVYKITLKPTNLCSPPRIERFGITRSNNCNIYIFILILFILFIIYDKRKSNKRIL